MAGEAISASVDNPTTNPRVKKKRSLPGTPDPEAEVIALSPKTLLATNRFLCEVCGKGFQRDQNLQLHRRGHNLPWKLRQRTPGKEAIRKRVYVCPERSCVHHNPSRALGDLTGIKKHFCRKHGEKKWKCDKCSKRYAVQSDCKAHSKTCGTREYRCDCGIIFSRRDSFITHRAFCDALALETARVAAASNMSTLTSISNVSNFNFAGNLMSSNMAHSFPSNILKPTSTESELLSLWIGQGPQMENTDLLNAHQNQTKSLSNAHLHGSLFSNGKQMDNQLNNWIYQNKLTSSASDQLSGTTTLSMSSLKEADQNYPQSLLVSIPSLQSSQHHHQEMTIMPGISATGLLQKTAQIGVTASSPSLLGNFEMNYYPNNSGDGFLHMNHSINAIGIGAGLDHSLALPDQINKICSTGHHADQKDFGREEETRDFLGVDGSAMNHGWI